MLKFVNPYVIKSKPINYLQRGQCCYYSLLSSNKRMSGAARDRLGCYAMDRKKKLKAVTTTTSQWRPVSTQAFSVPESLIKDVAIGSESGDQVQEVAKVAETMTEMTDSTISSNALDDNEDGALKRESLLSAEKHSLSLEVGPSLFRFIRGKEGSTQKKIEEEMGVKIVFPLSKQEESIVIEGGSIDCVTKASEKIQAVMDEAIQTNLDYSHFVSLPLAIYPELVDKLINFQNSILGDVAVELKVEGDKHVKVDVTSIPVVSYAPKPPRSLNASDFGIDKSIFINPKTFHLTVLMLKLWNKERLNAASDVLKNISPKVMDALDNRPVSVRLKGLDIMRGPSSKARVLYAPIEEIGSEDRLLRACQVITDAFVEAGLVLEKDAKQKLKLHATVMNARHRKGVRRKDDSFDARGIFKQFGSHEWGEYLIREAHLSQRFAYDENGYYHRCASIPFPESMQVD